MSGNQWHESVMTWVTIGEESEEEEDASEVCSGCRFFFLVRAMRDDVDPKRFYLDSSSCST